MARKRSDFDLGYVTALVETHHNFRVASGNAIQIDKTEYGIRVLNYMRRILGNKGVVENARVNNPDTVGLFLSSKEKLALWNEVEPHLRALNEDDVSRFRMRLQSDVEKRG